MTQEWLTTLLLSVWQPHEVRGPAVARVHFVVSTMPAGAKDPADLYPLETGLVEEKYELASPGSSNT